MVSAINSYGESPLSAFGNGALIIQAPDAPLSVANQAAVTDQSNIGVTWIDGVSNGGSAVIDYHVQFSISPYSTWSDADTNKVGYTFTISGLTAGQTYKVRVAARNLVASSAFTLSPEIIAASLPLVPTGVVTTISGANVQVSWTAASNSGSPFTKYDVRILQSDGTTYTADATNCPGTDANALTNNFCLIPVSALRTTPYSLSWTTNVKAVVAAVTLKGSSAFSTSGDGAVILSVPDAPQGLVNNVAVTSASQIGLTWYDGASNGGAEILDYQIQYAVGNGAYSVLQTVT